MVWKKGEPSEGVKAIVVGGRRQVNLHKVFKSGEK
jgi:hypothetical protein